jgi:hypothetical protein
MPTIRTNQGRIVIAVEIKTPHMRSAPLGWDASECDRKRLPAPTGLTRNVVRQLAGGVGDKCHIVRSIG